MNREQTEQLLAAYLTDTLDEQTRAAVEAELEKDAALRDRLADMRMVLKLLHSGLEQEPEPKLSEDRRLALLAAAVKEREATSVSLKERWYVRWPVTVAAIAASILLLMGITLPTLNRARSVSKFSLVHHEQSIMAPEPPKSSLESIDDSEAAKDGDQRHERVQLPARKGEIVDRNGEMVGNESGELAPFGMPGGGGGIAPKASISTGRGAGKAIDPNQPSSSMQPVVPTDNKPKEEGGRRIGAGNGEGKSHGQGIGNSSGGEAVDLNSQIKLPSPRFEGTPKNLPPIINQEKDSKALVESLTGGLNIESGESLSGSGGITKSGSATLALSSTNTLGESGQRDKLDSYKLRLEREAESKILEQGGQYGAGTATTNGTINVNGGTLATDNSGLNYTLTDKEATKNRQDRYALGLNKQKASEQPVVVLNGANTYTGGTTVTGGALTIGGAIGLGEAKAQAGKPDSSQLTLDKVGIASGTKYWSNRKDGRFENEADRSPKDQTVSNYFKSIDDTRSEESARKSEGRDAPATPLVATTPPTKPHPGQPDEKLVHHDDVLKYPANWPDLTEQRKISPTTQPAGADDKAVLAQLDRRLPEVRFDSVSFSDAVDFLRDITGTNIFVDWKALEAAGIDRNAPVSARLRDVKFSKVMEVLLTDLGGKGAKIGYTIDEGVITVSTEEDLKGRVNQNPTTQSMEPAEEESTKALPRASSFREVPVNPWVMTTSDRLSTFALDVDSASYSMCRSYLRAGYLPPCGAVRMEEFVNAFDYNYPRQASGVFNVFAAGAPSPFAESGHETTLVKIGVQGRVIGREGRKNAHLVFVVDTSGSMARADRMPLIQESMKMLSGALGPNDRVSLVTFNRQAGLMLENVPATHKGEIVQACNGMRAGGPTNLLAGLEAGYGLAQREFKAGQINRIILCTDGAANIGQTDAKAILDRVAAFRQNGITLTVAGFGQGGYNDELLETLAKEGDGSYLFIDTVEQARQAFVEKMNATLQTIALDAKIQVEFNPERVRRYRLIGYEKRAIADQDFRNDTVKAAEVGSGQSSTALYEVELTGNDQNSDAPLGTVYVRYRNADTQQVEEISHRLESNIIRRPSIDEDPRYFLAACAARFAEILRESPHAKNGNLLQVSRVLERVTAALPMDNQARELLWMVKRAQGLPKAP